MHRIRRVGVFWPVVSVFLLLVAACSSGENGTSTATAPGTSGFLYRSNKLMFDRKTETLWHQFRGVPAVGRWWAAVWNWKSCP